MNTKIRVHYLIPDDDKPRDEWKVRDTRDMKYEDYLALPAAELANTRARFIPPGQVEAEAKAPRETAS